MAPGAVYCSSRHSYSRRRARASAPGAAEPLGPALARPFVAQLRRQFRHAGEAHVDVERVAQHRSGQVRHRRGDRVAHRPGDVGRARRRADHQALVPALAVRRPGGQEVAGLDLARPDRLVVEQIALVAAAGDHHRVRVGRQRLPPGVPGQTAPVDDTVHRPVRREQGPQVCLGRPGAGAVAHLEGTARRPSAAGAHGSGWCCATIVTIGGRSRYSKTAYRKPIPPARPQVSPRHRAPRCAGRRVRPGPAGAPAACSPGAGRHRSVDSQAVPRAPARRCDRPSRVRVCAPSCRTHPCGPRVRVPVV